MALSGALLDVGAGAMRTAITHISIASANPDPSGSNQVVTTPARLPVTWAAVVAGTGDFTMTGSLAFTGGGNGTAAQYACFWNAATAGTYYGCQALTGDQNFNTAGEYTLTGLTINGAST